MICRQISGGLDLALWQKLAFPFVPSVVLHGCTGGYNNVNPQEAVCNDVITQRKAKMQMAQSYTFAL
eukprot:SAG31_NODE_82_length_27046_cov_45.857275_26_plen_67_part_00